MIESHTKSQDTDFGYSTFQVPLSSLIVYPVTQPRHFALCKRTEMNKQYL